MSEVKNLKLKEHQKKRRKAKKSNHIKKENRVIMFLL